MKGLLDTEKVDVREQYLKEYFFDRYPEIQLATLPIGDSVMRSEHKVGPDAHDYERLKHELMRLSIWRLEHVHEHHHLFVCDTDKYEIEKPELKILFNAAQTFRIFLHHSNTPSAMMDRIEDVKKNWYQANYVVSHLKLPTLLACMLAQIPGVSEDKAVEWARLLKDNPTNLLADQGKLLDKLYGLNKDGSRKKNVTKILEYLAGGRT